MPGATDNTPSDGTANNNPAGNQPPMNPFAAGLFDGMGAGAGGASGAGTGANPFGAFFNPFAGMQPPAAGGTPAAGQGGANNDANATAGAGATPGTDPSSTNSQAANPFASLFGAGGAGAGANPFGGYQLPPPNPEWMAQFMRSMGGEGGGLGSPAPPQDNRPPEERYADQLRQLNDMGFYDFDRNVAALRRSGGSVQGAIEHLLG